MTNPLFGLILLFMCLGYFIGKRKGRARQYALLAIPVAFGVYVGVYVLMAQIAY